MSVEGLWSFQSGSVGDPHTLRWGGVVVLESQRALGGDSVMTYIGSYAVDRDQISATVRVRAWNNDVGEVTNVFGMTGPIDYEATLTGRIGANVIEGSLNPTEFPQIKLQCKMVKMAELP